MHIRIIVKREKIEAYPELFHKITHLAHSMILMDDFLIIEPPESYIEITAVLENRLICYGIESEVELPLKNQQIEKEKGG